MSRFHHVTDPRTRRLLGETVAMSVPVKKNAIGTRAAVKCCATCRANSECRSTDSSRR